MPESSFALSGRRWPIKGPRGSSRERDKWQALQAIRYLNMGRVGSREDYLDIRNAVIREYGPKFWRKYGGPTWPKVERAKRKRSRTRRSSRRSSRRMAANPSKKTMKAYRFSNGSRPGVGFKLVVIAPSLAAARKYVKSQATAAHRALKYEGQGHPSHPESWCAAVVR